MIETIRSIPTPQRREPEGWEHGCTGEGRVNYTHENDCRAYVHFSWNGTIEFVHGGLLTNLDGKQIPILSYDFQYVIYHSLKHYLSFLETIGVEPPLAIFLTLTDVEGYRVTDDVRYNNPKGGKGGKRSRKPNITVKMREVKNYQERIFALVKKLVDNIWNENGWNESVDFSDVIEKEM